MKKFDTVADLLKGGGLAGHFGKAATFHKAKAAHHEAMAKAHGDYAAACKAKMDGMDDEDTQKAFMKSHADLHSTKAAAHSGQSALHKAHAEHLEEMASNMTDDTKAAATEEKKCEHKIDMSKACTDCKREAAPATAPAAGDLSKFAESMFAEAMKSLGGQADFKKMFEDAIRKKAEEMLAGVAVPDHVRGALPNNPNVTVITRAPMKDLDNKEVEVEPQAEEVIGA